MTVCQVIEICRSRFAQFFGGHFRLQVAPKTVCENDGLPVDDGAVGNGAANRDALVPRLDILYWSELSGRLFSGDAFFGHALPLCFLVNPSCYHVKKSKTLAANFANLHGFFLDFAKICDFTAKTQ